MGILDTLKTLVDVSIEDNTLIGITRVHISGKDLEKKAHVEDGNAIIDIESLDEDDQEEARRELREDWEDSGQVARDSAVDETKALLAADHDRIEDTLRFFRPKISDRHLSILRAALYLRETLEREGHVPKSHVEARKRDIAEKYGSVAYNVTSLCSAGYFDEGRYLRELYHEMEVSEEYKEGDYADAFEEIVQNKPFTVFVSTSDRVGQVITEVESRLRSYEEYNVQVRFIDIRGIGQRNHDTIRQAVRELEDRHGEFERDRDFRQDEMVVRVYPETVAGI